MDFKDTKQRVKGLFRGVFPKDNLPKDALLFIPLSPEYYTAEMADGAMEQLLGALKDVEKSNALPSERMELFEIIMDQVKKMALFGPLREKLIDLDAISTVVSAVLKCPFNEEGAGHAASFLSNMTIYTFKHHPGAKKHMERIEPYVHALLDGLQKINQKFGHTSVVMYAMSYALENVAAQEVTCAHLLKPEHPRTSKLLDFIIVNARGETEAQNSPIAGKCADAMNSIVKHALASSPPVAATILPGVSQENAVRMLDTMLKWHCEYYPWSWALRPAISQMMPHLLQEYTQIQIAFTHSLQKWSMHSAFGGPEGEVDATGKTRDKRPRVWDELVRIVRTIRKLPPSQCYVEVDNSQLRIAMFSLAPSPEIAYEFMAEPLP